MTDNLNHIEVAELGQIKVNAKLGSNIMNVAIECIALANLLKCSVKLYFNGRYIDVYTNSTVPQILKLASEPVTSEYEYEMFFDDDGPISIHGWYPIATNRIKHPEKIEEYIAKGLLRRIEKHNGHNG